MSFKTAHNKSRDLGMQKPADGEGVGLETEWISRDMWLRFTRLSVYKRQGLK